MNKFYITTTAPYVNAEPHIGFALEIVAADVIARYHRLMGDEVIFNTGTDEHGVKIYEAAQKNRLDPQTYVNMNAAHFQALITLLQLSVTHFGRTTNASHGKAAQAFWLRCQKQGDIYKKLYTIKYCVGCEMEKTDSELVEGKCPLHPNRDLETYEEENYFFRFSAYQDRLLKLYQSFPDYVKPESKYREITAFVQHGLQDFSISRLKSKMPWGIDVPNDPAHVMYVWFDALVYYLSSIGWPEDLSIYNQFWPGVQIAGKDNLRQQAAMWQAMLMSAGLPHSTQILINGFISIDGQKMSKSLGNVIRPEEMVKKFGVDGTRYLLLHLGPINGDIDLNWDKVTQTYNSDLANTLGNTVSRVAKLAEKSSFAFAPDESPGLRSQVTRELAQSNLDGALGEVWNGIKLIEKKIDETKPWTLSGQPLKVVLTELIAHLRQLGFELQPFMPDTAQKILYIFKGPKITSTPPIFPRL